MILAGYSKFQSKKGTNLCVMYFLVNVQEGKGAGYRPLKDAKGSVEMWASPDIEIDDSLIFEDVNFTKSVNSNGFEMITSVYKVEK